MGHFPPDCAEQSHAHDLQRILRTTLSSLEDHIQFIGEDSSLRNLELALRCAIADLERAESRKQEHAIRSIPVG
jgi:hypothetical protein